MSKPVIYWCAAAALAVGVVLMHVFLRNWAPWFVQDLQKPLDEALVSPWAKLVLICYLALSVAGSAGIALLFWEGVSVRDQQRWAAEREAQQRLSAMERQIREEQLPAAERQRLQASRARDAALKAEARQRLGLPETEPDGRDWL